MKHGVSSNATELIWKTVPIMNDEFLRGDISSIALGNGGIWKYKGYNNRSAQFKECNQPQREHLLAGWSVRVLRHICLCLSNSNFRRTQ